MSTPDSSDRSERAHAANDVDRESGAPRGRHGLPFLLTVDEVASMLRTTRTAVYAMAARGQLPGVTRLGRRMLIRSGDLLRWLDQNRAPSPKE
jgi:excisionase family DNA binding protein